MNSYSTLVNFHTSHPHCTPTTHPPQPHCLWLARPPAHACRHFHCANEQSGSTTASRKRKVSALREMRSSWRRSLYAVDAPPRPPPPNLPPSPLPAQRPIPPTAPIREGQQQQRDATVSYVPLSTARFERFSERAERSSAICKIDGGPRWDERITFKV